MRGCLDLLGLAGLLVLAGGALHYHMAAKDRPLLIDGAVR